MQLPTIVLVKAAAITPVNAVFGVLASGMRAITIPATDAEENPTNETPATHYFMTDMSALDTDAAEWQAMTGGALPAINGAWGAGGLPTGAEAVTAFSAGNVLVFTAAGISTQQEIEAFVNGMLVGQGLHIIPTGI